MRFAEFQLGQVIHAGPYEVSEEEIVRFATAYDPQWFHTDAQAAALRVAPAAGALSDTVGVGVTAPGTTMQALALLDHSVCTKYEVPGRALDSPLQMSPISPPA